MSCGCGGRKSPARSPRIRTQEEPLASYQPAVAESVGFCAYGPREPIDIRGYCPYGCDGYSSYSGRSSGGSPSTRALRGYGGGYRGGYGGRGYGYRGGYGPGFGYGGAGLGLGLTTGLLAGGLAGAALASPYAYGGYPYPVYGPETVTTTYYEPTLL